MTRHPPPTEVMTDNFMPPADDLPRTHRELFLRLFEVAYAAQFFDTINEDVLRQARTVALRVLGGHGGLSGPTAQIIRLTLGEHGKSADAFRRWLDTE